MADPVWLYRLLTGRPGLAFNRRVTAALNEGWQLYGPPVYTLDAHGQSHCAQAIMRQTQDATDYDVRVLLEGEPPVTPLKAAE